MGGWWRYLRQLALFNWIVLLAGYLAGRFSSTEPVKRTDTASTPATNGKKPEEDTSKTAALVAVLGLITPLAVALGALAVTGTVGRIQRNAEQKTEVAFILVVVASGLWLVGSLLNDRFFRALFRVIATLIAVIGTIFALVAAIATAERKPRPQIEASLNNTHTILTATVKAAGLKTEDRLAIEVDALTWVNRYPRPRAATPSLYESYVGPDKDGNVVQKLSVAIPKRSRTAPKKTFTHVGMKAYTGESAPGCDDFVKAVKKKKAGSGCLILSLAK
jgi:hypothetical protein